MADRIDEEYALIIKFYPSALLSECRQWILIPDYAISNKDVWNYNTVGVCVNIPVGYPGTAPYGIYVPADIRCGNSVPGSFQPSAKNKPPFSGNWGMFSWSPAPEEWKPQAELHKGSNLFNFTRTFNDRFNEGC